MTLETAFEKKTCGRCGGCGEYSYCQMYGTRCFGCSGKGEVYTKRGSAAKAFYTKSISVPLSTVTPGQKIYVEPGQMWTGGWWTVTAIKPGVSAWRILPSGEREEMPSVAITFKSGTERGMSPDTVVMVAQPAEVKAAKVAAALAYQETLTKSGKATKATAKFEAAATAAA